MPGVAIVDENDRLFWVDRTTLLDILESAITREDERLAEMNDYPDIWGGELPEARMAARTNRRAASEITGFLEGPK